MVLFFNNIFQLCKVIPKKDFMYYHKRLSNLISFIEEVVNNNILILISIIKKDNDFLFTLFNFLTEIYYLDDLRIHKEKIINIINFIFDFIYSENNNYN